MRRVLRLFLAEAALLGLAGGVIGLGGGDFFSRSDWAKQSLA